jgi:hypothetical protein
MHALMITFESTANVTDLEQPFREFATALNQRDGFVMKTWITSESTIGGFYVFETEETAERYLNELFYPVVNPNEAFSNVEVRHFQIHDELSGMTGVPLGTVADSPAVTG